jgi:hypothetical protein
VFHGSSVAAGPRRGQPAVAGAGGLVQCAP